MKIYDVRLCRLSEIDELQEYIMKFWRNDHVLGLDRNFLLFQHRNPDSEYLNFIIARNTITKEIDGIYGFILLNSFSKLSNRLLRLPIMFHVRNDVKNDEIMYIAFFMFDYFMTKIDTNSKFAIIGLSNDGEKFYKFSRKKYHLLFSEMNHFYILNKDLQNYNLAKIQKKQTFNSKFGMESNLIDIPKSLCQTKNLFNYAIDLNYLINRYFDHPNIKYIIKGLFKDNIVDSIFVIRKVFLENSSALQIIEILGTVPNVNLQYTFEKLLKLEKSEYIDCYNFGINELFFENMGFLKIEKDCDDVIIPTYFKPFKRENISFPVIYKENEMPVLFYGDVLDRP